MYPRKGGRSYGSSPLSFAPGIRLIAKKRTEPVDFRRRRRSLMQKLIQNMKSLLFALLAALPLSAQIPDQNPVVTPSGTPQSSARPGARATEEQPFPNGKSPSLRRGLSSDAETGGELARALLFSSLREPCVALPRGHCTSPIHPTMPDEKKLKPPVDYDNEVRSLKCQEQFTLPIDTIH